MGRIIEILIGIALISYLVRKVLGKNFKEADKKGHRGRAFPRGEVFPKVDVYDFPKEKRPSTITAPRFDTQYQTVSAPIEKIEPDFSPDFVEGGGKTVKDIVLEKQQAESVELEQEPKKKIDGKKMIIYSEILKPKYV